MPQESDKNNGATRANLRSSQFFKIVLPSVIDDKILRIPDKFVQEYGEELSDIATLVVQCGPIWPIQLQKDENNIWFNNGFQNFMEFHSISLGDFLLFKYDGNSKFRVHIFDTTACELRNDRELECYVSTTKHELTVNPETKLDMHEKSKLGGNCNEILFSRKLLQTFSKENQKRVLRATEMLNINRPCFITIIKDWNVARSYTYMPAAFANEYMKKVSKYVTVENSIGKKWEIELVRRIRGGLKLLKGWPAFLYENSLRESDICVFELIDTHSCGLKATFIRGSII